MAWKTLCSGFLSKEGAKFIIYVDGEIGPRQIEWLIRKLQYDKEIMETPSEPPTPPNPDCTGTEPQQP